MPIDELGGHFLGGALRIVGRVLLELLFELPVRGLGYAILSRRRRRVREDDLACVVVGLLFWAAVAALVWLGWCVLVAG